MANKETNTTRRFKHGLCGTREYTSWHLMRRRCTARTGRNAKNYAGRGITVCERWNDFAIFLIDMGPCPPGMSIERIDNDKGYCPENCRWATPKEQNRNTRRTIMVTIDGQTQCLLDWAKELGVPISTVNVRIHRGHSPTEALFKPKYQYRLIKRGKNR